ncbi:hypothetical protein, partial [Escherichia coli]|uniref:hypothetical protein n=2 Tax=Enterobacterales TaxID=91347 RepID=UPI001B8CD32F
NTYAFTENEAIIIASTVIALFIVTVTYLPSFNLHPYEESFKYKANHSICLYTYYTKKTDKLCHKRLL